MGILIAIAAAVLCAIVYVRMVRREVPEPLTKKQAVVPVLLGIPGLIIALLVNLLLGLLVRLLFGKPLGEVTSSLLLKSLLTAFAAAGLSEELAKLVLCLLAKKLLKPKNVYEVGVIFAGVGFGFTIVEELIYGGGNPVAGLARLPGFAMHIVFQVIMGTYLGLALYHKRQGKSSGRYLLLGLGLPVLWHTVFDAASFFNKGLDSENETVMTTAAVIGLAVIIVSVVLQFIVLVRFRKETERLCGMEIMGNQESGGRSREAEGGSQE